MAEIQDLTTVDASNIARFPEGQAPSTVNNGARALEGLVARWHRDLNASVTTAGTSTAFTYAANQTLSAYYDGLLLGVDFNAACGAAPTINVDSIGAKTLMWPDGTSLTTSDVIAGQKSLIVYDGTDFIVLTGKGVPAGVSEIQDQKYTYASSTGSVTNSYSVALSPAPSAYTEGMLVHAKATLVNDASANLAVNGLGAKLLTKAGGISLASSDLPAGDVFSAIYDGTNFQLVGSTIDVDVQTFNSDDTWTKPARAKSVHIIIVAGGASG
ncbi:hypothetical protein LCGC14_2985310, partial [marine sediment metagenome]